MTTQVAAGLLNAGLTVGMHTRPQGKELREIFDCDLHNFRCGVVVLGQNSSDMNDMPTGWQDLLDLAQSRETPILPVWLKQDESSIVQKWPYLNGLAVFGACEDTDTMIEKVLNKIEPKFTHFTHSGQTVTVSPNSFPLHTGACSVKTPIRIKNLSENRIYEVAVKLVVITPNVPSESVEIVSCVTTSQQGNTGGIILPADLLMLDYTDSDNNVSIALVLHTLGPQESSKIIVEGTMPFRSDARVKVCSFNNVAADVSQGPGAIAISSLAGEITTDKRIRVLPLQAQKVPMKKLFQNVVWPAVAGSVAWSFFFVLVEKEPSDLYEGRLGALFAVFIYLAADWCLTEAIFEDINPYYWIADIFLASSISIFAIITTQPCLFDNSQNTNVQLCSDRPPKFIAAMYGIAILFHLLGAWDKGGKWCKSDWCERLKSPAATQIPPPVATPNSPTLNDGPGA